MSTSSAAAPSSGPATCSSETPTGVVVVPSWFAEECVELTEVHEEAEEMIKKRILSEGVVPGKYYPPGPETYEQVRAARKQK